MGENRNMAKGNAQGEKNGSVVSAIIGLCALIWLLFCAFQVLGLVTGRLGIGREKTACETAELAVASNVIGEYWSMESKVIYKNSDDIVVAVKYWLPKGSKDSYWVTYVLCGWSGESWYRLASVSGVDYDHISKDNIKEIKLKWELK